MLRLPPGVLPQGTVMILVYKQYCFGTYFFSQKLVSKSEYFMLMNTFISLCVRVVLFT